MSRLALVVSCATLVAVVGASPMSGSPKSSQVIRLGVGIGQVRLDMTYAQVRRALGRPQFVNRRQNRGFGNRQRVFNPTKPSFVAEVMVQHAWLRPVAARCTWDWTRGQGLNAAGAAPDEEPAPA